MIPAHAVRARNIKSATGNNYLVVNQDLTSPDFYVKLSAVLLAEEKMKIILGSASRNRYNILKKMGYEFEVMAADIDEKAVRDPDPEKLTRKLAHAKADAILPKITGPALLITSDQVVWCKGEILEKPANADEARRFLTEYAFCPAFTYTAVAVANTATGIRAEGMDIASAVVGMVPPDVIEELIADGRVFGWSGGFSVEDPLLKPYIISIRGEIESIEGLPVVLTRKLLAIAAF